MYQLNTGVIIFGQPTDYNIDYAISEYKTFVDSNSKFSLVLTIRKYPPLSNDEIASWPGGCYFPAPWSLRQDTITKIPSNVQSNIILYNFNNLSNLCWGGGAYKNGVHGVPTIFIPLVPSLNQGKPCGLWKTGISQALVHEWLHALSMSLNTKGYSFPDADKCTDPPYNFTNINCWYDCYKYFLSTVTEPMYKSISIATTTCPTGQIDILGNCINKKILLISGAIAASLIILPYD